MILCDSLLIIVTTYIHPHLQLILAKPTITFLIPQHNHLTLDYDLPYKPKSRTTHHSTNLAYQTESQVQCRPNSIQWTNAGGRKQESTNVSNIRYPARQKPEIGPLQPYGIVLKRNGFRILTLTLSRFDEC